MATIDAIDKRLSTYWGIAHITGISAVGSAQYFMLANRITGRAHELAFAGGGVTLGIDLPSKLTRDKREFLHYKSFTTTKPVNFEDFNGRGASLTNIKSPIYSRNYFTINKGSNPVGAKLARIQWGGWSIPNKLKLSGHAWVNGVTKVTFGSGKLNGNIRWVLDPDQFPEDFGPVGPRLSQVRSAPSEPPLIQLPGDVLFPFGSSALGDAARPIMMDVLHGIEMKNSRRVLIEGHTDSKGSESFNMSLSAQRAETVKRWLVNHGCERAPSFATKGCGEAEPITPNSHPNGKDNPEGRAMNRRVVIRFN